MYPPAAVFKNVSISSSEYFEMLVKSYSCTEHEFSTNSMKPKPGPNVSNDNNRKYTSRNYFESNKLRLRLQCRSLPHRVEHVKDCANHHVRSNVVVLEHYFRRRNCG